MKKILIIQTAFIGDVILALPLAQYLKERKPGSEIHFLLRKGHESLLENHPAIDKIWIWNKKEAKTRDLFRLVRELRQSSFSEVYNLQRFFSTGLITFLLSGNRKYGFKKNPFSFSFTRAYAHQIGKKGDQKSLHEVQRNLSLTGEIFTEAPRPQVFPSEADREKVRVWADKKPYVVLAPSSVWYTKQLHAEKWKELIRKIPATYQIYLVGATGEKEYCDQFISISPKVKNLCGQFSFLQSAALMEGAYRVFVNDSAPQHLASAVNAPTTSFFCSTVPEFGFGPLSDVNRVVQVRNPLPCRPCGLHGFRVCPKGHFKCSTDIDTGEAIMELGGDAPPGSP